MNKKFVLLILAIFSLGWFSSSGYSSYFNDHKIDMGGSTGKNSYGDSGLSQNKDDTNKKSINVLNGFEKIEKLFSEDVGENIDQNSPYDWIKPRQISVYNDRIVIKVKNPEWAIFTNTKSMDPVIDSTANALEIIPESEEEIHTGDIVAYESKYKDGIITHRIVEIGHDISGWYAKLKGDNNDYIDPGKIRFEQIRRVVIGIIY